MVACGRDKNERQALQALVDAKDRTSLQETLVAILALEKTSTLAEDVLAALDRRLRELNRNVILLFDGLDTDFEGKNLADSQRRRQNYVGGLLQVASESRNKFLSIKFKVFLREDIWNEVIIQNKLHFGASVVEIRWHPEDLWRIALDQLMKSKQYQSVVQQLQPGVSRPWPVDRDTLELLLTPFWGRTIEEAAKKARTANYVLKRISDAKGRVFPRTLVQLLNAAIKEQLGRGRMTGRVIGFVALRTALDRASILRVQDLEQEYGYLRDYLKAMKGMPAIATQARILSQLQSQTKGTTSKDKKKGGVKAGTLHAGPGGWKKVIAHLIDVGVLGSYERREQGRLAVAMLYRPGLGVKGVGLH